MKVFVYGTLLKGQPHSEVLHHAKFLGMGLVQGSLYDVGYFPGLVEGSSMVSGELYEVNNDTLRRLDEIEGYHEQSPENSLYLRKEVTVIPHNGGKEIKAFTYHYRPSIKGLTKIHCGDYRRYLIEKPSKSQWYLAYGSNMNISRLVSRVGKVETQSVGSLHGFRLIFNKDAGNGYAYANIQYVGEGFQCPFVAYLLSNEQILTLDGFEGVENNHYLRAAIPFENQHTKSTILGQIYLAHPSKIISDGKTSDEYLQHIRTGYLNNSFTWIDS